MRDIDFLSTSDDREFMVTRDELYKLVWSEPMTKVAKNFGVSGSYLARICSILNVPRPERGHWAKLAVGKAAAPRPLPESRPGDPVSWSKEGDPKPKRHPPTVPAARPERKVKIPRDSEHALIRAARSHFGHARPTDDYDYLRPYKRLLVDVSASKTGLETGLILANDLFNALESIGCRVVIAPGDERLRRAAIDEREVRSPQRNHYYYSRLWSPQRPTVVYIGTVAIGLAVIEMSTEVVLRYTGGKYIRDEDYVRPLRGRGAREHTWTTTRELPSGRFRIIAYSPYGGVTWEDSWQEGPRSSIRSSIRQIVAAIENAAPKLVIKLKEADRQAELARQEWQAAEERRRREEDRRLVEQSVNDSEAQLAEVIQQWAKVVSVEQFFAEAERRARQLAEPERGQTIARLELARAFLGTQDPLDFIRSWRTPAERYKSRYPNQVPIAE